MSKTVSRPYFETLRSYGAAHPEVFAMCGDLTKSCEAEGFQADFPERFLNMGMAEQNMIGVAGGMAHEGLLPIVHTFGVFITRRAFDQVHMSIGSPCARVRLMGFLPGLTTPGGVTHQAIDDMAVMSCVPGMSIVDPADATEIQSVLDATHDVDGPVFCRMVRGDVPVLFDTPMVFGKVRVLSDASDILIISSSVATREAMVARQELAASGINVGHIHISTLKPLDDPALLSALDKASHVITVENHLTSGGLGSRIAEILAESASSARLQRLGVQDRYAGAGSQAYLIEQCGFAAGDIVSCVEGIVGRKVERSTDGRAQRDGLGDLARQEAL